MNYRPWHEWRSVSESPKEHGLYAVWVKDPEDEYWDTFIYDMGSEAWQTAYANQQVMYWMPLPPAPGLCADPEWKWNPVHYRSVSDTNEDYLKLLREMHPGIEIIETDVFHISCDNTVSVQQHLIEVGRLDLLRPLMRRRKSADNSNKEVSA